MKDSPPAKLFDGTVGRELKTIGRQVSGMMMMAGGHVGMAGKILNTGLSFLG